MSKPRKNILTIAGFDPSGGAGLLADVKTFEQHRLLSFGVQTANTIQSENKFMQTNWIDKNDVLNQLEVILNGRVIEYVKVGLIESLDMLEMIIQTLTVSNPNVKIIWDPILSTSSGFDFNHDLSKLTDLLKNIYLITPNWNEVKILSNQEDSEKGAKELAKYCNVYLKGGHNSLEPGKDFLFSSSKIQSFKPKGKWVSPKHGSGCIFSSALASNLALGYPMQKACLKAKSYITRGLESNKGLLAYHKF